MLKFLKKLAKKIANLFTAVRITVPSAPLKKRKVPRKERLNSAPPRKTGIFRRGIRGK